MSGPPKAFKASLDAARHPTPDEFSHSVTRCAVAHLALGVANTDPRPPTDTSIEPGFTSADTRAIELLSDIVGRYIETIGLNASENANAAGRTSTNAYDVLNAFGSLTPALSIKDLHAYARDKGLEVPFDRDVSSFPKRRNQRGSGDEMMFALAQHVRAKINGDVVMKSCSLCLWFVGKEWTTPETVRYRVIRGRLL